MVVTIRIQKLKKQHASNVAKGFFDSIIPISNNIKKEISWQIKNLHIPISNPDKFLKCDVSTQGNGAVLNDIKIGEKLNRIIT